MRGHRHRRPVGLFPQGQGMAGQPGDELDQVVEDVLLDELHDAARGRRARHEVGALAQCGDRVGDGHRALREGEERVVVLGIADADHVVRRQLERRQRVQQTGALGDAGRQQHESVLVEHERPLDAGLADGGEGGLRERRVGGHDRAADVQAHAAPPQRIHQCRLRRVAERADLPPLGKVHEGPVLGHDGVEHPIEVGADRLQVREHAAGDEQELASGRPYALERPRGRLGDAVRLRDGAVVIGGDHVNVQGGDDSPPTVPRRRRLAAGTAPAPRTSSYTAVVRAIAASSE